MPHEPTPHVTSHLPSFLAMLTTRGPRGEADFTDNRYWVREAAIVQLDPARYAIVADGRWLAVTNAAIDPAHGVRDTAQPVRVFAATHGQYLIFREPMRSFEATITNAAASTFREVSSTPFAPRTGQLSILGDGALANDDTVLVHELPRPDNSVAYVTVRYAAASPGTDDATVSISANDANADYLVEKLIASDAWVTLTEQNDGSIETLALAHASPQDESRTSAAVTSFTQTNDGSDEVLRVTQRTLSLDARGHVRDADTTSSLDLLLTAVEVVTDYRVDTTTNALQKKTRTVYVPKADAESAWTNVHVGETC